MKKNWMALHGFLGAAAISLLDFKSNCAQSGLSASVVLPQSEEIVAGGQSWLVSFDNRTRIPRWAIQRIRRTDVLEGGQEKRQGMKFFPEMNVPEPFRVRVKDYSNSGFDRGHMVPAADCNNSEESMRSTFTMANISPQVPSLNKGLWAKLEAYLRFLLSTEFEVS